MNIDKVSLEELLEKLSLDPKVQARPEIVQEGLFESFILKESELRCPVCKSGSIYHPLECRTCSKLICRQCTDIQGSAIICPMCRGMQIYEPSPILLRILDKQKIKDFTLQCECYIPHEKCTYGKIVHHIEFECGSVLVKCPNLHCEAEICRENLQVHLMECLYSIASCSKCDTRYHIQQNHDCIQILKAFSFTQYEVANGLQFEISQLLKRNKDLENQVYLLSSQLSNSSPNATLPQIVVQADEPTLEEEFKVIKTKKQKKKEKKERQRKFLCFQGHQADFVEKSLSKCSAGCTKCETYDKLPQAEQKCSGCRMTLQKLLDFQLLNPKCEGNSHKLFGIVCTSLEHYYCMPCSVKLKRKYEKLVKEAKLQQKKPPQV